MATLAAVVTTAGCSGPPTEMIDAAREVELDALAAGANEYTPGTVVAVDEARAALDAEMAVQSERRWLARSYARASELAEAYRTAADDAFHMTIQARDVARLDAERLIQESHTLLLETQTMLDTAPTAKGSSVDLAALGSDLEAASAALAKAESSLQAEEYLEAVHEVTSAKNLIESVGVAIRQAQAFLT